MPRFKAHVTIGEFTQSFEFDADTPEQAQQYVGEMKVMLGRMLSNSNRSIVDEWRHEDEVLRAKARGEGGTDGR